MKPIEGRTRVIIEDLQPEVDCGRYPAKRVLGEEVEVTAAIFADGHDHVAGRLLYRPKGDDPWRSTPMQPMVNDVFRAHFTPDQLGEWEYSVEGWIDHFDTWASDLQKRIAAQPDPTQPSAATTPQNIPLALRSGAILIDEAAGRAPDHDRKTLEQVALSLRWMADQDAPFYEYPIADEIREVVASYPDLRFAARYSRTIPLWIDRERARF